MSMFSRLFSHITMHCCIFLVWEQKKIFSYLQLYLFVHIRLAISEFISRNIIVYGEINNLNYSNVHYCELKGKNTVNHRE